MTWLWLLIRRWLGLEPSIPVIEPNIGQALRALLDERDWFVWECEQCINDGFAPWFDPYRYEGTRFRYPDPSQSQIAMVFNLSEQRARERYGQREITALDNWSRQLSAPLPRYEFQPDPVGYALKEFRAAN